DPADAAVAVDMDLRRDGLVAYVDVPGPQRVGQGDAGIVFGLDRADRDAVGVAGADAAGLIGVRVAGGWGGRGPPFEAVVAGAGPLKIRHRLLDCHVDKRQRNPRHWIVG